MPAELPDALARLAEGAGDTLTEDIVARLARLATEGLSLLDAANRSGIAQALPALSKLAAEGDLDRLVALSRLAGAMGDALTEDIVARLAHLASQLLALAEQAQRSHALADFMTALDTAAARDASKPPPAGGAAGLWQVLKTPETQAALRFAAATLAEFRAIRAPREG